jgi:hypothetical protein
MNAKLSRNAKATLNLLIFNIICVVVVPLFLVFYLPYCLLREVFLIVRDVFVSMKRENVRIYFSFHPRAESEAPNKQNPQHKSIGLN